MFEASRPLTRHAHWQALGDHGQLFVVNGSRLFDVDGDVIGRLEAAARLGTPPSSPYSANSASRWPR